MPTNNLHQASSSPLATEPYLGATRSNSVKHRTEYRGATVAACGAVWLKRILKELGVPIKDPILLYCDKMSGIHLARNLVFHAWTKHIEVHYHFIRERFLARDVDMQHISTHLQMVDIFTKALGADKLR